MTSSLLPRKSKKGLLGFQVVSVLAIALLTSFGCEEVDDQTIIPAHAMNSANPRPTMRDFEGINKKHEILMAIIDSGTDYNHPFLIDHIHFDLEGGGVTGAGFDFVGNDKFPAPYVALTSHLNPDADKQTRDEGERIRSRTDLISTILRDQTHFFDPNRNLAQEMEVESYHGTHVAGLMTYDEPRLGLIPYRVLPINMKLNNKNLFFEDKAKLVFNAIVESIDDAVKKGVRVINLSLAFWIRADGGGQHSGQSSKSDFHKFKEKMKIIENLALTHPHVMFVAASGNEGQCIDENSALQLPCGVNAPNIICVGALNEKNNLSSFSNVPLTKTTFVAAPGKDILSLFPTQMCDSSALKSLKVPSGEYPYNSHEQIARFIEDLGQKCKNSNGFKKATGTSMAAPIVARMIGKILLSEPHLNGAQAINQLVSKSDDLQMGPLNLKRLFVERPSWYPDAKTSGPILNRVNVNNSGKKGFFELFVRANNAEVEL